jgi:hypothetical protein
VLSASRKKKWLFSNLGAIAAAGYVTDGQVETCSEGQSRVPPQYNAVSCGKSAGVMSD